MRVAVISEGETEYAVLPRLYPEMQRRTGHQFMNPLLAHITPLASHERIARECKPLLKIAAARRADLVVVLLDHEARPDCSGTLASALEAKVAQVCRTALKVRVVYKVEKIENWLLADLDALRKQSKRYSVTPALRRKVEPNRADYVDALELLERACSGDYDKVEDGQKIAARLSLQTATLHSRSLRHLLHVLGDDEFGDQCRSPHPPNAPSVSR